MSNLFEILLALKMSIFAAAHTSVSVIVSGFTCDEERKIHAMRLFIGQPIWTPFNRPQEHHPSRQSYAKKYLSEEKKEETA